MSEVIEAVWFQAALLLALPLLGAYAVLAWRHFVARRRPREARNRISLTLALVCFPLAGLHLLWLVLTAKSSTAAIAIYYLPLYASITAAGTFLLTWSLIVVVETLVSSLGRQTRSPRWLFHLGMAAVILIGGCSAALAIAGAAMTVTQASNQSLAADELMAIYAREGKDGDLAVLAALASHPNAPPELLVDLARRDPRQVRRPVRSPLWFLGRENLWDTRSVLERIAGNPHTPEATLRKLASDRSPTIAAAMAANPSTPIDVLRHLASRTEMEVGLALTANPRTGVEGLSRLANHPNEYVRERAARSPRLPAPVLARLARDPSWVVRGAVALNPATPPEVLEALAGDPDSRVRFYVATNPRTPDAAIRRLSNDSDERVRRYATQRLDASHDR